MVQLPFTQSSAQTPCSNAAVTSQAVPGEVGLPAKSSAGSVASS